MDFLKLIVFSTLIRYLYRCNIFPVSKISVPFGSVTIYDVGKSFDVHCMQAMVEASDIGLKKIIRSHTEAMEMVQP